MILAALAVGTALVAALGCVHHYALYALGSAVPRPDDNSSLTIQLTFLGLLLLHVVEILVLAAANGWLLTWEGFGGTVDEQLIWGDVLYLTGVNFTTLGYARIELAGPVRIVTMLQSLGGFMLLTWSATYLFTVSQRSWRRVEDE
ncbi:ion channel [Sagittula salina]|uniref:Potassium channel domain-containing protein n=1 Tax=Sagittula salina TaxID=2820268 RepID=A0A940S086_9RHOB|nr:ion channel [Sagittula salina]MBP0482793.1 hypothetical protein [Sagittula salina]